MALLHEFVDLHSESAFAELVRHHLNLVYSIALRHVGNAADAQDVTQAVFIILAKKAAQLRHRSGLTGWLYETTRFTSTRLLRTRVRQSARDQEAYMQSTLNEPEVDAAWRQLAPHLEDAMSRLAERDRTLLALRFYENQSGPEAAATLGINEAAAHKRVGRALEKLRKFFARRGITLSTLTIAAAVSANSVSAAPAGLATTISAIALTQGATAAASTATLVKGALKLMAWTKAKIAMAIGVGVVLAGTTTVAIYESHKAVPLQNIPADWSVISGDGSQWNWTNHAIHGHSTNGDSILASTRKYGDVTLSATIGSTTRGAELVLRLQDADNGYHVVYTPDDTPWAADNGSIIKLVRKVAGDEVDLGVFKRRKLPHFAKITARAHGPWLEVRLDDIPVIRTNDAAFASGFIGLRVYGDPVTPCDNTFSNLTIQ